MHFELKVKGSEQLIVFKEKFSIGEIQVDIFVQNAKKLS